jgi:gliding motility-associated-like protein
MVRRKYQTEIIPIFAIILLCLTPFISFSQGKQANIWYFGFKAGVDFNAGSPPAVLLNSQMGNGETGCASIADSTGQLLFYSDGKTIWNKNHVFMQNGQDMGVASTQGAMIVPCPDNNHLYYYFNFIWDNPVFQYHFQYSVIDMNLDNGNGGVVADKKRIRLFNNTSLHLSAVRHVNGKDIWVVTHGYQNDRYYSFLVNADSLNRTPVVSTSGSIVKMSDGYMKISPDGRRVGICTLGGTYGGFFESIYFDNETGMVSDADMVHKDGGYHGVEYSPDNTKLYINTSYLFQYDLNAGTPQQILASEVALTEIANSEGALQLGPDGKIYCAFGGSGSEYYLSLINAPNENGLDCNFERDAVYLEGRTTYEGLPSFIQSYLNDPTFTDQHLCLGDATTFDIDNTNGIDSVYWKFNDFPNMPNDTSTQFSPQYVFSHAGTFHVDLTVYSGLLTKTVTRDITINPIPEPNLGNDTLFCNPGFIITLKPNCDGSFRWNDFSTGPELIVSDTGTYWVRVTNNGCSQTDSIHIGLYPLPQLDETNLTITNAGCGQPTGTIAGLQVNGTLPFEFLWIDLAGDTAGTNLDLLNQYAGSYALNVIDGNGCDHLLGTYSISDNGSLQVDSVQFTNIHCNQPTGAITIYTGSLTPDLLDYSIDGGTNYFQNNGVFAGLPAGTYNIKVKDANDCIGEYDQNPVVIDNIPGPQITGVDIVPEDNNLGNGSINIHTLGGSGDLTYSIGNGIPNQINDGLFINLSAGNYLCSVTDAFGCDTTFSAYVSLVTTDTLKAIAGFGSSCVGDAAVVSLELTHFTGVKSFMVTLHYDPNVVSCAGYLDLNPQLELGDFQATIQQATGEIKLNWEGQVSITLPDQAEMLKLKFDGLGEGLSPVNWEAAPGESHFYDDNMQEINTAYSQGQVDIYSLPEIQMQATEQICTGDTTTIDPEIIGGNGHKTYTWTGPNNFSSHDSLLRFDPATINQAGSYTLLVQDAMSCEKSSSVELIVMESPIIAFSGYDTLFVDPGYLLDAGNDALSFLWNNGATTSQITIDTTGLYSVEAFSGQGCKSTDAVWILWAGTSLFVPNAFTPNEDGLNDVFGAIPRLDYVNQYYISIYNRWGQLIFETRDIDQGWDGTYQGKACPVGAYVYRIVYNDFGMGAQETKVMEGTVVLVR